uniref:Uncharacterized protein n=1 Tax=Anopheles atroparvus TaxID=41427 RepID=A0A182JE97_ANOAO
MAIESGLVAPGQNVRLTVSVTLSGGSLMDAADRSGSERQQVTLFELFTSAAGPRVPGGDVAQPFRATLAAGGRGDDRHTQGGVHEVGQAAARAILVVTGIVGCVLREHAPVERPIQDARTGRRHAEHAQQGYQGPDRNTDTTEHCTCGTTRYVRYRRVLLLRIRFLLLYALPSPFCLLSHHETYDRIAGISEVYDRTTTSNKDHQLPQSAQDLWAVSLFTFWLLTGALPGRGFAIDLGTTRWLKVFELSVISVIIVVFVTVASAEVAMGAPWREEAAHRSDANSTIHHSPSAARGTIVPVSFLGVCERNSRMRKICFSCRGSSCQEIAYTPAEKLSPFC